MRDLDEDEDEGYYNFSRRPPTRQGGGRLANGGPPAPAANVEDNSYMPTSTVFKLGNGIAVRPNSRGVNVKHRSASPPTTTQLKPRVLNAGSERSVEELRSDFRELHEKQHDRIEALLSAHKKQIIEEVVSVVAKLEEVASTPPQLPLPLVPLTPEMREHPWYSLEKGFGAGGVRKPIGEPAPLPGMINGGPNEATVAKGVSPQKGSPPQPSRNVLAPPPMGNGKLGPRKKSRSPRGPEVQRSERRRSTNPREAKAEPGPPQILHYQNGQLNGNTNGHTEVASMERGEGAAKNLRRSEKSALFVNSPAEKKVLRRKSLRPSEDFNPGKVIRISSRLGDMEGGILGEMPTFSWGLAHTDSGRWTCAWEPRSWAQSITKSRVFELLVSVLIAMNAITIGAQADWDLQHAETAETFRHFDLFFTVAFTCELCLRIFAQRSSFFSRSNSEFFWNIFDSALVAAVLMEEVALSLDREWINVTVARVLRMQRLVRASRVVRAMRFFRDLRTMVTAIAVSIKMLVWALLLLFLVMFLFAVVVMQIVAEAGIDPTDEVALNFYGSFVKTFYTLWMSILGGIDWQDAASPLWDVGALLGMAFCFYIAFAQLCVLNIVTGIFVENATKITERDDEKLFLDELQNRRRWVEDVEKLFRGADRDGNGQIDFDFFEDYVKDQRTVILFKQLGIDLEGHDTRAFFDLLDFDNDGKLSMSEFVLGLQRINGKARSVDLAHVMHDCKALKTSITELSDLVSNAFSHFGYVEFSCTPSQFINESSGSPNMTPKASLNSRGLRHLGGGHACMKVQSLNQQLLPFDEDTPPSSNRSDEW